jgi:hypothetical protein
MIGRRSRPSMTDLSYEESRTILDHAHEQRVAARQRADAAKVEADLADRTYHAISERHTSIINRLKEAGRWEPR